MRLPFLTVLAAAAIGAVMSQPVAAQELELIQPGKILIATEGTYPPFSMRAPDGTLDGLEIRVGKEIARRLNLEYTPVIIKWESLLVGLEAGQYDFASDAMDITAERQKQVMFADGWLESGGRVVTKKGSDIKKAADIKGRTVGVLVASTWQKLAEERGATVKTYKAESDALQDLVNGNIDGVITDSIAAAYAIQESKLPLTMTEDYVSHVQKGFPFKKGKPNLVKAVNKALADMVADGTYAKLTTPIIGYSPAPKDPIRTQF
ncbi:transporter substrate-binding domain-containing protein [Ancylobacter pratisalsi]|uniref:Transporter substrate-binding domain-containing protein n=1 Tax=Ancylobacter pratisalsi TaxID=1745854 RepID=A0A6P1YJS1_9HYPH|nr:transporter substrate-binding domain-containing protein [Ancylobacter pratisalsi]QIB33568.1 transporter substrate-binding domain-containing protein [Ancylobacter pratisalsi]